MRIETLTIQVSEVELRRWLLTDTNQMHLFRDAEVSLVYSDVLPNDQYVFTFEVDVHPIPEEPPF